MNFEQKVDKVLKDHKEMLMAKNKAYGNSALEPVRIFSKVDAVEQLKVRIDDKLSRLAKGTDFADEDTVTDLLGYLVLLKVALLGDDTSTKLKEVMEEEPFYLVRNKGGALKKFVRKPVKGDFEWYDPYNRGIDYSRPYDDLASKYTYISWLDSLPTKIINGKKVLEEDLEENVCENPPYKEDEYLKQGEVGYMEGKLVKPIANDGECGGCCFRGEDDECKSNGDAVSYCCEDDRDDATNIGYVEVKE